MIPFKNDYMIVVYSVIMVGIMFVAYRFICPDEFYDLFKSPVRFGK